MIYDQLRNYCECIKEVADSDIDELINLVSMLTCWTQKPCENLLQGEREQVIHLPSCLDECDVFEFEPFYAPFDSKSFEFTLVAQTGIEETLTPITEYRYSEIDKRFRMELPIPSCKCAPPCGCPTKYKLLVKYVAGYEDLPECLLPVLCEALQYVIERKKCDCEECQECSNDYDNGMKNRLIFDSDKITEELRVYFIKTLSNQYVRELSLISLCGKSDCRLWGFRV